MPPTCTISVSGRRPAQGPVSTLPRTANTGAIRRSASSTSGLPTSPAWMIGSQPCSAATACRRSRPCVSEMTPMYRVAGDVIWSSELRRGGPAAHLGEHLAAEKIDAGEDVVLAHSRPAHPHGDVGYPGTMLGEQHVDDLRRRADGEAI